MQTIGGSADVAATATTETSKAVAAADQELGAALNSIVYLIGNTNLQNNLVIALLFAVISSIIPQLATGRTNDRITTACDIIARVSNDDSLMNIRGGFGASASPFTNALAASANAVNSVSAINQQALDPNINYETPTTAVLSPFVFEVLDDYTPDDLLRDGALLCDQLAVNISMGNSYRWEVFQVNIANYQIAVCDCALKNCQNAELKFYVEGDLAVNTAINEINRKNLQDGIVDDDIIVLMLEGQAYILNALAAGDYDKELEKYIGDFSLAAQKLARNGDQLAAEFLLLDSVNKNVFQANSEQRAVKVKAPKIKPDIPGF